MNEIEQIFKEKEVVFMGALTFLWQVVKAFL